MSDFALVALARLGVDPCPRPGRLLVVRIQPSDFFFAQTTTAGDPLADLTHTRFGFRVYVQHVRVQGGILRLALLVEVEEFLTLSMSGPLGAIDDPYRKPVLGPVYSISCRSRCCI